MLSSVSASLLSQAALLAECEFPPLCCFCSSFGGSHAADLVVVANHVLWSPFWLCCVCQWFCLLNCFVLLYRLPGVTFFHTILVLLIKYPVHLYVGIAFSLYILIYAAILSFVLLLSLIDLEFYFCGSS